jgi:glutamate--cysteine ligase
MHFLDIFLTYCLLKDSPDLSLQQQRSAQQNMNKVATCGRDTSLELLDGEISRSLRAWAEDIFSELGEVACLIDQANLGEKCQTALNFQHQKLINPARHPLRGY